MPRKLQAKIHSEKSTEFSVWNDLRSEVSGKYVDTENLDDYGNHLIREFNRRISIVNSNNQNNFNDLYFTPYDAGFRFLGSLSQEEVVYAFSTAYNSANSVLKTEASNYLPNDWMNGQTNVTSVTLKTSLISIGSKAFYYCSGLTSVTIPNSVTSIGNGAFQYSGLTSVTIPSSVTSMGTDAFYESYNITSATLNGVIGVAAFSGCYGLTSVTIGNSVTSIGSYAFYYCTGLTSVTIPSSVTNIGRYALSRSGLTSVTIPNSVTSMGNDAFNRCTGLTSVAIGTGITSIASQAFETCTNLSNLSIGSNVQNILSLAFAYCASLPSVTIPISVTSIGSYAFTGCTSLSVIYCYAASSAFSDESILIDTPSISIFARILDPTWANGSYTVGGKTVTVVKNLT